MRIHILCLLGLLPLAGCGVPAHPHVPIHDSADDKRQAELRDPPAKLGDDKRLAELKYLTSKPVTVEVPMSKGQREDVIKAIEGAKRRPVTMTLRGVQVPEKWNFKNAIHVFVNKPNASADTSPEAPNFVFAFYLSPLSEDRPQNFAFDLAPALKRLKWKSDEAIRVTFVVVPPAGVELPADLKVPFDDVSLPPASKP